MRAGRVANADPVVRRLHVLILNWQNGADTVACLRSVRAWTRLQPTVWVVDNGSADGSTALIASQCPPARLIASATNGGFSGGNNLGLAAALADGAASVLLLNNDATIDEAAVERLLAALEGDASLAVVGPLLRDEHKGTSRLSAGGRDVSRHVVTRVLVGSRELARAAEDPLRRVDHVPGTVALIRGDALRAVGLFDEAYFFGGELADFCARARQHGYASAVDLGALATHSLDRSADLRRTLHAYYVLRNRFLYVRKFQPRCRRRLFARWMAYGAGLLFANLVRGRVLTARAIGLGVMDGVRGRFGGQNDRVLA